MHLIASAYDGGHGVEKDEEKAHIWRRMAEQAGFHSPDTIFRIAIAHFQGTDRVPKDIGKVLSLKPESPQTLNGSRSQGRRQGVLLDPKPENHPDPKP